MEEIIQQQHSTLASVLAKRTAAQWHDYPDFGPLIEPLKKTHDQPYSPGLQYLLQLVQLVSQADEELSTGVFILLESYCVIAEPTVAAQAIAHFILEAGEPFPSLPVKGKTSGWLELTLDYKYELRRKGTMVKKLWAIAASRGENIQSLVIQFLVDTLAKRQELEKEAEAVKKKQEPSADRRNHDFSCRSNALHDTIYMLHCGPLSGTSLPLRDIESALNALERLRDGSVPAAFENQLLILVNLLDRIFMWFESKDSEECIDQLKLRVTGYARTPELFLFVMDNVLKYLDGRWIRDDTKENIVIQPKVTSTSLIEINRNREPIRYSPTGQQGTPGSTESSHIARGKALKEREVRVDHGREARVREYELSDLVARCLDGQDSDTREQFVLRFLQHLMLRIDTVMVNASSAALKQAAHQREKILLRLMSENPIYRRIMISALHQDRRSVALCLPHIQGMLRCSIGHWSSCKSPSPSFYPKELEDALWLAQLAEQTGLIPDPINQAAVLFPLIDSKDVGQLLEQCYYILLVRNADILQQQQILNVQIPLDNTALEVSLIHRLIFKHAVRTFHLMPLFAQSSISSSKPHMAREAASR